MDAKAYRKHGRDLRKGRTVLPGQAYLVTAVTYRRIQLFEDLYAGRIVVRGMMRLEQEGCVTSLAFVLMPDHLHWLFTLHAGQRLGGVMRLLKGRSSFHIGQRCNAGSRLWQAGYHDHALRSEENILPAARYLLANPLRAGLVRSLGEYPHWDAVWL